ncbi:MAG: alkaline phosphatase D family protein [Pseudoxanthomonas sp.]
MLTIRMLVAEFMDSFPVADCSVVLEAQVIAGWQTNFIALAAGSPTDPMATPGIHYDEARSIRREVQALTDAQGQALLVLDLNAAVARVSALIGGPQTGNATPDVVETRLSIKIAEVHGLALAPRVPFKRTVDPNVDMPVVLVLDLARSIVGDTTHAQSRLWFQLHAPPAPGDRYVCELKPAGALAERRIAVGFAGSDAYTATVTAAGLSAATAHAYRLLQVTSGGLEYLLTQGSFRTLPANPQRLQIAFTSCHLPSSQVPTSLGRWKALAAREDIDFTLQIGDQIYGDGIDLLYPSQTWQQRYVLRYTQLWNYQPVRDVLRSRPNYMVLDDHEIADDWGIDDLDPERIEAGLQAYRTFQQAHGPGGQNAATVDYHFRRGPAAFYVTDSRTARGKESAFPILGSAQFSRIRQWAASAEVRDADVVVVAVPVPPAMLPINALEDLAAALAPVAGAVGGGLLGAIAGAVIGGVVGAIVGGPAGAAAGAFEGFEIGGAVGAFAGAIGAEIAYQYTENTILEPDIRDAWTYDKNLPDLVHLFDTLFDIANDVGADGQPGPHPRAVIILSGDYHFAAIHHVMSGRARHANNPTMVQATSSPISTGPTNGDTLVTAASIVTSHDVFDLDPDFYTSRFVSHLSERNFGRMSLERVGSTGRRYRFQIFIEGETEALVELFDLDLDARPVKRHDLIGDLLSARGRISLLRVNDLRGGYGPTTDRLDGEVIVQLDTEPGRAFGFQLRDDDNLPVRRRMLALLRDAFTHDRPITIDYLRTGPLNGQIIRASELPTPPPAALGRTNMNLIMRKVT